MSEIEFTEYGKTQRFFRDVIVTEKIDGTNAGIHIRRLGDISEVNADEPGLLSGNVVLVGHDLYAVQAQSRKRLISPGKATDNYGFAAWCQMNAAQLVDLLGQGLHFGEWWGVGINRGYGLNGRRFSLFNTDKYGHISTNVADVLVDSVPLLYHGTYREGVIGEALADLSKNGSRAAWGYMNPEGVVIFHTTARMNFKVTLDGNDAGKWEAVTA
jgi:hypothetical protein